VKFLPGSTNGLGNMNSIQGMATTTSNFNKTKVTPGMGEVWVKKWVDYSTKYGLGYLLSNGNVGVFFNDSTKIILDSKG